MIALIIEHPDINSARHGLRHQQHFNQIVVTIGTFSANKFGLKSVYGELEVAKRGQGVSPLKFFSGIFFFNLVPFSIVFSAIEIINSSQ